MLASIPTAAGAKLHVQKFGVMRGRTCQGLLICTSGLSLSLRGGTQPPGTAEHVVKQILFVYISYINAEHEHI